jgi:hypothetical protein
MRIYPSPVFDLMKKALHCGWHRHAAEGTFPHMRSSPKEPVLSSNHGLANAKVPNQASAALDAAILLRSAAAGTATKCPLFIDRNPSK